MVTDGVKGAYVYSKDYAYFMPIYPDIAPPYERTGAGDAFVGAFSVGLALGLDDATAVRLGTECASDSVTRLGTQSSYPSIEQAKALLARVER